MDHSSGAAQINKRDGFRLKNLFRANDDNSPVALKQGQFASGVWDISESDAKKAVGGMLNLHATKAKKAAFVGKILDYAVADTDHKRSERIIFIVEPIAAHAGNISWPKDGKRHAMAHYSGLVEAE